MVEDKKWCAFGEFVMVHPVMLDLTNGGWVSIQKVEGQGTMHRHAAAVTVRTLDGAGGYREQDWVARAGSFANGPAGNIHTLYSDPQAGKMTALFHGFGRRIYFSEKGDTIDYDDVFLRLDRYSKRCHELRTRAKACAPAR
jgi:hypothetical protein